LSGVALSGEESLGEDIVSIPFFFSQMHVLVRNF
jgi:hypothetical protein